MTNHLKEVEKLINHLRQVINDLIEENEVKFDDVAWVISHARKHLDKAKGELEGLKKNE